MSQPSQPRRRWRAFAYSIKLHWDTCIAPHKYSLGRTVNWENFEKRSWRLVNLGIKTTTFEYIVFGDILIQYVNDKIKCFGSIKDLFRFRTTSDDKKHAKLSYTHDLYSERTVKPALGWGFPCSGLILILSSYTCIKLIVLVKNTTEPNLRD